MPIPDYQSFMLPMLQLASDGQERAMTEVSEVLANQFGLGPNERSELLPSGQQFVYHNRIGWAKTYLVKAGLLESPGRGKIRITPLGAKTLELGITRIDNKYLMKFEGFRDFRRRSTATTGNATTQATDPTSEDKTLDESLGILYQKVRKALALELIDRVMDCSPTFFERLVVELLVAMGYGGSVHDAGQAIGRSGDGGIDGIIKQDRLGLDNIYIQAKRWKETVGSPEVRTFAGSLAVFKASKGVLLTTSDFSRDAVVTAGQLGNIVLINGETLAEFMIDYGVGVSTVAHYEVKRVDRDYFEEG